MIPPLQAHFVVIPPFASGQTQIVLDPVAPSKAGQVIFLIWLWSQEIFQDCKELKEPKEVKFKDLKSEIR